MTNVRSLVLCAGFGQRLRPLTDQIPKPCVPFFGLPLLDFILHRLQTAKIENVAFNLHHLPEQIEAYVKGCPWKIKPYFSLELPQILNTGGALYKPLTEWLGDHEQLLVLNGDVLTDLNLNRLIETHLGSDAIATIAILPKLLPDEPRCLLHQDGLYRGIAMVKDLAADLTVQRAGYACAYIVNKAFSRTLTKGEDPEIFTLFARALQSGEKIQVYSQQSQLFDLGSPKRIWDAHRAFLNQPRLFETFCFDAVFKARGQTYELFSSADQVMNRQKGPIQVPVFWSDSRPIPSHLQLGPNFIYAGNRPLTVPENDLSHLETRESIILNSTLCLETPLRNHLVIKDIVFPISS